MVHNRACPVCGKIVEWTRGELKKHKVYGGTTVTSWEAKLICPEHGEFEPRSHKQLDKALTRVMKRVSE